MKKRSILWRFAIPISLLFGIIIIALSVFITKTTKKNYEEDLYQTLVSQARLLESELTSEILLQESNTSLDSLVTRYASSLQCRVTIIQSDGSVIADTESDPMKMDNHLTRPEVQQAIKYGVGSEVRYSKTTSVDMLYVAIKHISEAGEFMIIRMAVAMEDIDNRVVQMNRVIWYGGIAAISLSFLITYLITQRTIRPLVLLTKAAQSIAAGNFYDIPRSNYQNEIGVLTRAFSHMSLQIQNQLEAIEAEKKKFSKIVDQMADGIIIVDNEEKVILINPAAKTMLSDIKEVEIGKSLAQTIRYYQIVELCNKTLETKKSQSTNVELQRTQRYVHVISSILEGTETIGVLMLFQDITHQRNMERMRQEFVSNVSHELRTPLASIRALTETVERSLENDPVSAKHFLSRMGVEIEKLDQMVMELLDLARIESGRVQLKKSPCEVSQLLKQSVNRMKMQAERAGIKISSQCSESIPVVLIDTERIEQVLINLIHNAIKFTPPGGEITLSAEVENDSIIIHVTDTGVGIAEEDLPRIFERFFKTDRARSSGGTGLGLSIAKHVIETHGGKIWVESKPGSGSTFSLSLPIL